MNRLVKVVIPIYTNNLKEYERMSLRSIYDVLGQHPLVVIKPDSLDLSELLQEFPKLQIECFEDGYFDSISSYNRLMMSKQFYARFSDVAYILIAQLDAFIFRDELVYWCEKGYDYIGGPWLVRPVYRFPLLRFTSWLKRKYCELFNRPNSQQNHYKVGNGGLSLRRVASHLKAVDQLQGVVEHYLAQKRDHVFNEDVFFSVEVNKQGMNFSYPHYMEALKFSFDKYPGLCYELNEKELPMGCHSWYKRRMKGFWLPIILENKILN